MTTQESDAIRKGAINERTQSDYLDLYLKKTKDSFKIYDEARKIMPGGQSHNARFYDPYPFYAEKARGKLIWDVDGNMYTDYWMGHTALILGHSPPVVVRAINSQSGNGLLFGAPNRYAFELASLVNKSVRCAESVRFCTSGAEATMYAVRLARAYTKRKTVVKMRGGWHGYNSALTIGVTPPFNTPESRGLIDTEEQFVSLAEFNDIEATRKVLGELGEDLACVILEPVMGAGGVISAKREYLQFLRDECDRLGAVLIFDEIITGFRLALGGAQEYFGVKPNLCTLGKILGGGLPVSAVAGENEILSLADTTTRSKADRCWIGGGTFSENALCLSAGIATLEYLIKNKVSVYGKIGKMGSELRKTVDKTFADYGIRTKSTGLGSLFVTHFLSEGQEDISDPKQVVTSNHDLEHRYYFDLIAKYGIYFIPGHIGAISNVHTLEDIKKMVKATEQLAMSYSGKGKKYEPKKKRRE